MEKKNQKQLSLQATKISTENKKNIPNATQLKEKKWLNHKKILTETIYYPKSISSSANLTKHRPSSSQLQKKSSNQKLKTAANTWSTQSNENNKCLVNQMSKLNQKMKQQNERLMNFIKQIQPQLDYKLNNQKFNTLTKVSLSQKIKNQSQMIQALVSMPTVM